MQRGGKRNRTTCRNTEKEVELSKGIYSLACCVLEREKDNKKITGTTGATDTGVDIHGEGQTKICRTNTCYKS